MGFTTKTILIKFRRFGSKPTSGNLLHIVNNTYSVFISTIKVILTNVQHKKPDKIVVFQIWAHGY